jgi:hypothetical protein
MCGEKLPDRTRRTAENRPSPPVNPPQPEEKTHDVHREKSVEAPASPANPVYSMPPRRDERRVETWGSEPPRRAAEPSNSSTSFLGLGNTEYEKPEREISWRFWALMLLILGVAALFGMQWRASKLRAEQQQQQQQKPAATAPSDSGDEQQPKDQSALPSPTPEQLQPNQAQPPVKEKDIPPGKGADAKAKSDEGTGGDAAHTTDSDNPQPPKEQAALDRRAEETPRGLSDAPVQQADHLIQGGACNDAVRVLRNANGNPRAMTKLAAMYLTGTCVGPDRVMAYTWFSQAFSADPHNLRLENARRMVWSQMSDDERARVESSSAAR